VNGTELIRGPNKATVLNLVRQAQSISRTQIARQTGLSRSAVSTIVAELLEAGWIVECGSGKSSGGRRPILLAHRPQAGYVLGLDVGASHLSALVTDLDAHVLAEVRRAFDVSRGPGVGLPAIASIGEDVLAQGDVDRQQLLAVGIAVPGPLDYQRGTVIAPPIMPGWDGFPIRSHLEVRFGVPVYLDNDANLGALGELRYGAGRGLQNLAFIKVATGIGCGIVIDGRIYHGQTGAAGEIGHVVVDPDGPPCTCGGFGCLEAMAGGPAIAARAGLAIQAGQSTILRTGQANGNLSARDVAEAARRGDPLSRQLFADAGRLIGLAAADVINLLNPGRLIIGGGVSQAGDLILETLRETVDRRTVRAAIENVDVVQSELGVRSTALGAVALALQETFKSSAVDFGF